MNESQPWLQLPQLDLPTPVLTLAALGGRLWAGGAGGVAVYPPTAAAEGWEPCIAGLHLGAVAALAVGHSRAGDKLLIAGGVHGLARSVDGGRSWCIALTPAGIAQVAAFALAPDFDSSGVGLAASMGGGVLRSVDGGFSWEPANFGLSDLEVSALAWGQGESVLAGTADGIYRSPNGGRAWRAAPGSEGLAVAALAWLPGGGALAALEQGGLRRSSDGLRWAPHGNLPSDLEATTLLARGQMLLLGSTGHGLLRSTDGGETWQQVAAAPVLTLAEDRGWLYAGTDSGLLRSDDSGVTWKALATPPVHDLRQLLAVGTKLIVRGSHTGALRYDPSGGWLPLAAAPSPLAALTAAPDGSLSAADPIGLARSVDSGTSWQRTAEASMGQLATISIGLDGEGWAGAADGSVLLRTSDSGASWQPVEAPFGVLALLALQALPGGLLAVTYDPRQGLAQPWRTQDGGMSWERGLAARTPWPLAATSSRPPLLTLGDTLHYQRADGSWERATVGPESSAIRRVVGVGAALLALTTHGIYRSDDGAATWAYWQSDLPDDQIIDLALVDGQLWALLAGGRVWRRASI